MLSSLNETSNSRKENRKNFETKNRIIVNDQSIANYDAGN